MSNIIIDFETRSALDIKKAGVWAYAAHPSTEILCMGYRVNNAPTKIWTPQDISYALWTSNFTFTAHNAEFERAIWYHIGHKRYEWPEIPIEQWRCTAAKAAALSLPRKLVDVAKALGLSAQKDMEGHRIMLKICKPRKPLKAEKEQWIKDGQPLLWHDDPEDYKKLFKYCKQDVDTEYEVNKALRDLSLQEQQMWFVDQKINGRGVHIDVKSAEAALRIKDKCEKGMLEELDNITKGAVETPRQVGKLLAWLEDKGLNLNNLTKQVVTEALELPDIPDDIRRTLEIRQSMGLSSLAKITAMLNGTNEDNRVRSTMMYHGSHTGRWSGMRIQPHNMTRGDIPDVDACLEVIGKEDINLLRMLWGDPLRAISSCIRGLICAAPGNDLICADLSSIEARITAWLAGEQHVLDSFISGLDLYAVTAARMYHKKYEEVVGDDRLRGKFAFLGLGYGGAVKALQKIAEAHGVKIPDEEAKEIVYGWRDAHPKIVQYWWAMEETVKRAIVTGKTMRIGDVYWGILGDFLFCKLPSDRLIAYYKPDIRPRTMPWGETKDSISYMGVDSTTHKWGRQFSYGGKLVENVVQAIARDILAEGLVRLEAKGYPIILHVHDEALAEVVKGFGSLEEFEQTMSAAPKWAKGLPIDAKGWRGKRYRKD